MTAIRRLGSAADLDAATVRQVSAGALVSIEPALANFVQAHCDQARAALSSGAAVYGVTTGMGALSGVLLTDAEQRVHQRNLLIGRATGGPPWLPETDVREIGRASCRERVCLVV